jgi:hypothetical protein
MSNYLSKKGYVLRKELFTSEELMKVKMELRGRPLVDSKFKTGNDTSFPIYIETKNKLYIPKMYGISRFGLPTTLLDNYNGEKWVSNDITFTGTLYPIQEVIVSEMLKACKEKHGGILEATAGVGKTICTLKILSELKHKTIIIVNKIPLMKQWESEIRTFLPNAKIGFIQGQKNVEIANCNIVIGMLQSIARIEYPDELFADFGVAVFDETHNLGSQMFSKVLFKLCCKYTIGLSATPQRSDGCEYVFKWHIGNVEYKIHSERKGLAPIIKNIKIDSKDYKEISTTNKFTGEKQIQFTSMLSDLIAMPKRNALIIHLIKQYITENRKILVLSDRRSHLTELSTMLKNDTSVTFTHGLFVGSMKTKDLDISRACNCILATFAAFSEGVSEKDLDTLILVTPKKFVGHLKNAAKNDSGKLEQVVGRIFRKSHTELNPIIIDFQDNFSVYKNQAATRRVFYKEHFTNATIEHSCICLDDDLLDIKIKKTKEINKEVKEPIEIKIDNCIIED